MIKQNAVTFFHVIFHKITGLIISHARPPVTLIARQIINAVFSGSDFINQYLTKRSASSNKAHRDGGIGTEPRVKVVTFGKALGASVRTRTPTIPLATYFLLLLRLSRTRPCGGSVRKRTASSLRFILSISFLSPSPMAALLALALALRFYHSHKQASKQP